MLEDNKMMFKLDLRNLFKFNNPKIEVDDTDEIILFIDKGFKNIKVHREAEAHARGQ